MKNLLLFLLVAGSVIVTAAVWTVGAPDKNTGIQFTDAAWNDILKKAKNENKVIFLDLYASWCGPCKMLKRTTFRDEAVVSFFNTNFVNATFDGEKGQGQELMLKYKVRAYPTMLFIYPDGSVKKTAIGYHNASQLMHVAKVVLQ